MRDSTRLRAAPFLWGALVLVAAFVLIYLLFVRTYVGQIVDERAFIGATSSKDSIVTFARRFLGVLPFVAIAGGLGATVIIALIRRNWRVLIVAGVAVLAANASTAALKHDFLGRPQTGATLNLSNSFPSGHTTVAASVALAIFLVSSPRFRPLIAVLGAVFSIVAGVFTLISQWHRPSDVIAGLLVVAFWGCAAGCALAWSRMAPAERPAESKLRFLWWISLICALAAGVTFVVIFVTVAQHGSHLEIAYFGGVSAITAVGLALAASGNRLFRALR